MAFKNQGGSIKIKRMKFVIFTIKKNSVIKWVKQTIENP